MVSHPHHHNSRVPDQNGVSTLYIMLEIHNSGWEPSNYIVEIHYSGREPSNYAVKNRYFSALPAGKSTTGLISTWLLSRLNQMSTRQARECSLPSTYVTTTKLAYVTPKLKLRVRCYPQSQNVHFDVEKQRTTNGFSRLTSAES